MTSTPYSRSHLRWTQITQLVALNTPPIANGLLVTYVNDSLVLSQTGLVWRTDERVKLSRVLFSTFFGGSSSSYLPAKDQVAHFKDFQVSFDIRLTTSAPTSFELTDRSDVLGLVLGLTE